MEAEITDESTVSASPVNRFPQLQQAIRVLSHGAIWVVVLVPVVIEIHRGWRAIQDNATISIRSYEALSLHPPLLGQYSTLSAGTGHLLYDPGPLQYWLLAIPVHISPANGALWGSAVLAGLALSLSVEGLWRSGERWACGVLGLVVLNVAYLIPRVYADPGWNPYFGFLFLLASIGLAWVVATGSLGWWPWLVVTASVAIQSEAFFSYFAIALIIGAPFIGMAVRNPPRWRWLAVGLIVGGLCWLPTAIQEVTGSQHNLSLLLGAENGEAAGVSFGLKNLALAGSPIPVWGRGDPFLWNYLVLISHQSVVVGILALLMCMIVLIAAWKTQRKRLAALATLGLILSLTTVYTFGATPTRTLINLWYLNRILWPVGIVLWITAFWSFAVVLKVVARRYRPLAIRSDGEPRALPLIGVWLVGLVSLCIVIGMFAVAIAELNTQATERVDPNQIDLARSIAQAVEQATPKGPVSLSIAPGEMPWTTEFAVVQGAAWQLIADGWQPGLSTEFSSVSGITYPSQEDWRKVAVAIFGDKATADRIEPAQARSPQLRPQRHRPS